jgi:hypothetical protein
MPAQAPRALMLSTLNNLYEEVGNAIAGDWVKVNDVFYTIITTSPTVESDFLLIGNVTQLQLQSKTVSWAQVTDKSSRLTQPKLKYH